MCTISVVSSPLIALTEAPARTLYTDPVPNRDVVNQTLPGRGTIIPGQGEFGYSGVPAGDGKIANLFLQCTPLLQLDLKGKSLTFFVAARPDGKIANLFLQCKPCCSWTCVLKRCTILTLLLLPSREIFRSADVMDEITI
jgi:hypothetical protein